MVRNVQIIRRYWSLRFLGKTGYNTNGFVLQAAFGFHLYITPLATIEPIPIAVLNDRQLDLLIPGSYPLAIF